MSADTLWSAGRYESVAEQLAPLAGTLLDEVESLLGPLAGLDDAARERFWAAAAEAFSQHRTSDGLDIQTAYLIATLRVH